MVKGEGVRFCFCTVAFSPSPGVLEGYKGVWRTLLGWQMDKIYFLTRFLKDWNLRFFKHKPAFALGDANWEFWTESGGIRHFQVSTSIHLIKYLDVGPQAQLPPPYAEDISALLTMVLSWVGPFRHSIA